MRVILFQNINGLGKKFDVKNVKDGYARNFLLRNGLVKVADEKSLQELEIQKARWEKEETEFINKLGEWAKKLESHKFDFVLKIGKRGEVFGSVSKDDILREIENAILYGEPRRTAGIKNRSAFTVELDKPIKKIGEHQAIVDLGGGIKAAIKVDVLGQK